jgi:hypothetical protein
MPVTPRLPIPTLKLWKWFPQLIPFLILLTVLFPKRTLLPGVIGPSWDIPCPVFPEEEQSMANPKSISVSDLAGAVHKAVANVKPPAGTNGPYAYINPGLICGIIYYGPGVEFEGASTIANAIAASASEHLGQVTGIVQTSAALGAQAATAHIAPKYLLCGFKTGPDAHVRY